MIEELCTMKCRMACATDDFDPVREFLEAQLNKIRTALSCKDVRILPSRQYTHTLGFEEQGLILFCILLIEATNADRDFVRLNEALDLTVTEFESCKLINAPTLFHFERLDEEKVNFLPASSFHVLAKKPAWFR